MITEISEQENLFIEKVCDYKTNPTCIKCKRIGYIMLSGCMVRQNENIN